MQISAIGSGIYTELARTSAVADLSDDTQTEFEALTFTDVNNVRDFPSIGTPANIVNVAQFGQAQSSQIQAQADAPSLEFTLNYIPNDHDAINQLAGDGKLYTFRVRLANSALPDTLVATTEHSDFYFHAQVAAFLVNPSLSDSNTATLTLAIDGDFYGPFTTS